MDLGTFPPATGRAPAPALRLRRPGWRDPRLWVGIALVAASVLLGARLLATADDTVGVWAARVDLPAGSRLSAADLVVEQVRLDDATAAGYLGADQTPPESWSLQRTVGAGELLPLAAIGETSEVVEVPIAVAPDQIPGSVVAGSVVDVYLLDSRAPGPALADVTVLDASLPEEELAVSGSRRLVLAVPQDAAAGFLRDLGAQTDPRVTVVRRG